MRILLLSDIHANFPALEAVTRHAAASGFDMVCNCGDSTVYAPFPNETIAWLREHEALSILGNTDRKVLQLAEGKNLEKPRKPDKRIMYSWTMENLEQVNLVYLMFLQDKEIIEAGDLRIGLYHGSPEDRDEFLFHHTNEDRFRALAKKAEQDVICIGHSHSPFYKKVEDTIFINPGSVGRMFDGNPAASYAMLEVNKNSITVSHHRIPWDIAAMTRTLKHHGLPALYATMYETGRKLN